MLIEYKFFEPAFTALTSPIGVRPTPGALKLGRRRRCWSTSGHHAQGVNIEQIVTFLLDEGRLGGFHFNNRKYADDDLIVGSTNPYELFLIYNELAGAELGHDEPSRSCARDVAVCSTNATTSKANFKPSFTWCSTAKKPMPKPSIVPRQTLAGIEQSGDVLMAHCVLSDAFRTDVRPLLAQVRLEMGVPDRPHRCLSRQWLRSQNRPRTGFGRRIGWVPISKKLHGQWLIGTQA
jgi:L-rhamnose isomerase/sugar isomerase